MDLVKQTFGAQAKELSTNRQVRCPGLCHNNSGATLSSANIFYRITLLELSIAIAEPYLVHTSSSIVGRASIIKYRTKCQRLTLFNSLFKELLIYCRSFRSLLMFPLLPLYCSFLLNGLGNVSRSVPFVILLFQHMVKGFSNLSDSIELGINLLSRVATWN